MAQVALAKGNERWTWLRGCPVLHCFQLRENPDTEGCGYSRKGSLPEDCLSSSLTDPRGRSILRAVLA